MIRFRVATYNIHKGVGMDRRLRPERIVDVLRELEADVIALQEVLSIPGGTREQHQATYFADEIGLQSVIGETRMLRGGSYGNVVLTRFPVQDWRVYDISVEGREERACLRTDVELPDHHPLHVFNIHLGTGFMERRKQGRKIVTDGVLHCETVTGPRVVMGDFNEWTRGLASKLLCEHFQSPSVRQHLRRSRTYPGILPFLHLDHIYHDHSLKLERLHLHKTKLSLVASDHLPLVADFTLIAPSN